MIPKLIRLGVETILKIICEKIIIKNILIVHKKDKFTGKIDKLCIKAEDIIFNKINISLTNIYVRNIVLRFGLNNKKKFLIENCNAEIHMRLTSDNVNKTLFHNKWKRLKTSIESFLSMSFQSVKFNNKSIYFVPSDEGINNDINYTLQYDKNNILLVNNFNKEKLSVLNDKNIIVKNLFFCESYIQLELISKIAFN